VGELLDLSAQVMKIRRPKLVNPKVFFALVRPFVDAVTWGKRREVLKKARVYIPYASYAARFDVTQARAGLEPLGLKPPPVSTYFRALIEYAIATDWGKNLPSGATVRY
jgi:hypothetical protein